jgi:hypothetical protein
VLQLQSNTLVIISNLEQACEGKVCLDNTPDRENDYAKLIDVNLCVAKDVKDVIHCLDGIQVTCWKLSVSSRV